jgi:hypothetical protein
VHLGDALISQLDERVVPCDGYDIVRGWSADP